LRSGPADGEGERPGLLLDPIRPPDVVPASMRSPNVIFLVLDTARYDRFGSSGCELGLTPNTDAIAESGRYFASMIMPQNWTTPNHAAFFTGLFPRETGTMGLTCKVRSDGVWTMAEAFQNNGYSTAGLIGNRVLDPVSGITRGFQRLVKPSDLGAHSNLFQKAKRVLGFLDCGAGVIRDKIGEFSRTLPRPFFIFANFLGGHWPYLPLWRYEKKVASAWRPYPLAMVSRLQYGLTAARRKQQWQFFFCASPRRMQLYRDRYHALLHYLDSVVGEIAQAVKDAGLWEETVFIVTSDHGENTGDHGLAGHAYSLHDTLVRIPFVAHVPGAGTGCIGGLLQANDLLPSLIDACELSTPLPDTQQRPYHSMFAMSPSDPGREFAYANYCDDARARRRLQSYNPRFDFSRVAGDLEMVRTRKYKWIRRDGREELLFDIETDPGEADNLLDRLPEEASRLRAVYAKWDAETPHYDPLAEGAGLTEEEQRRMEAQLRAIGYM
jgi:arylsulfatase A-like enzyme